MPKQGNSRTNEQNNRDNLRAVRGWGGNTGKQLKRKGNSRDWSVAARAQVQELDRAIDEAGGVRPIDGGAFSKRMLVDKWTSWFRIHLPFGNNFSKAYLLQILTENMHPLPFQPRLWRTKNVSATFFVDDYEIAEKLEALDRKIPCADGYKLIIRVSSGSPKVNVTMDMKDKMKIVITNRYNAATNALDLTRFHDDPDLQELFCALFKPYILLVVIDIIAENFPELEELNLNDNRIHFIDHLRILHEKLPHLKILNFGNNKIREMSLLDPLEKKLPLIDLVLEGNPVCEEYKDRELYIRVFPDNAVSNLIEEACAYTSLPVYREILKRFPKVKKLDGIDLPPRIGFDISEDCESPTSQQTFFCNNEGQEIVHQFLEQYFKLLDSDSRQPLQQVYHENAVFSMTMNFPFWQHPKNSPWFNWYITGHKDMHVWDEGKRCQLLKQGKQDIVAYLSELHATKHDICNFTVDLMLFTPQMLLFTVTGIFEELISRSTIPCYRHCCRTLLIVPAGSGFCITNELLHVSIATRMQFKAVYQWPTQDEKSPVCVKQILKNLKPY